MGALAGLHAGLHHAAGQHVFAVACDMPYLNSTLIRKLSTLRNSADVVIPHGENGPEPLHSLYGKKCLPFMEAALAAEKHRIVSFFTDVNVCNFSDEEVAMEDPDFNSFRNINTPVDYYLLRANPRNYNDSADQRHEPGRLQYA
jgi:molybdopterin-guanine dinucleotide biosynthesis protein A